MMKNELLWFLLLSFDFAAALLAIKYFGKQALYALIIIGIIVCNIQVLKLVNLFSFTVSLGNIAYGSIFLSTDLISECYGKKEANKAVSIGFFALVIFTISIQIANMALPSEYDVNSDALKHLFKLSPRIAFASILAYVLSQYHDVWSFDYWKQKTKGKHLWLRNNISTMSSQTIDSAIFVFVAFLGVYNTDVVWSIFYTTLLFKLLVAVLDTPIVYLGRYILNKQEIEQLSQA